MSVNCVTDWGLPKASPTVHTTKCYWTNNGQKSIQEIQNKIQNKKVSLFLASESYFLTTDVYSVLTRVVIRREKKQFWSNPQQCDRMLTSEDEDISHLQLIKF